ncbi:hypothetical protein HHI36_020002, partial [Cryptolaemus montrouzieri]
APFACDKCNRKYRSKGAVVYHLHNECGVEPKFCCDYPGCNFKAKQKGNLKRHKIRKH